MVRTTAVPGSCYFYYPRLVCVVGVRDEAKDTTNFAPVTWATPLSSDPPMYGICLSPKTYTHQLVLKTGEFTVNFLPAREGRLAESLGKLSGREIDKVRALGLEVEPGEVLATPSLAVAYASAECLLLERHQTGDETLFVGEVQRLHVAADAFDHDGVLNVDRVAPLLYLGSNRYATVDPASSHHPEPLATPRS
ncbi:MAG: flavin reductase family protein [Acidobacteriota bacterium]